MPRCRDKASEIDKCDFGLTAGPMTDDEQQVP